jgi:tyrosine-specific transport protein
MNRRVLGASLLIAGTTIGAGMLALPMTSSELGFSRSVLLLVGLWLYMMLAGCVMVGICQGRGRSIALIAEEKLGPVFKHIAGASLLILFWTLLAAYISGGSSILYQKFGVSRPLMALLYTAILGIPVILCTRAVDNVNRILFLLKVSVFVFIIMGLSPFVKLENLMTPSTGAVLSLKVAIPVFFTAFGFHGSLPVLINYLHGSKKNTYISIVVGSAIPLVVYIIWQAITLGVLGMEPIGDKSVGEFIDKLTEKTGNFYLSIFTDVFAFFAMATSFLGVALSLFDYLGEWFPKKIEGEAKMRIGFLTFALPLLFALLYPRGFVFAIGFAAIALSLLAVVLPGLIVLKEKKKTSIFLNKGLGFALLVGGMLVIAIEVVNKFS